MANWLQKFTGQSGGAGKKANLPVVTKQNPVMMRPGNAPPSAGLPPATIVYGIAAGALFAVALCFLLTGSWLKVCW